MAKILIHVQHLLGTGHARRMAAIANGLARSGHDTVLASGGMSLRLDVGAAKLIQLPACRAQDATFKVLIDANGNAVDESWREARAQATLDLYAALKPDLLIVELYPLGRALLRFELEPLIARAGRIPKLVSIRDVPQRPADSKIESRLAALGDFAAVLAHGDEGFLPATQSFPELARIGSKLIHTGYIAGTDQTPCGQDEIVVSVGGGAAGVKLLDASLKLAARRAHAGERWRILTGEQVATISAPNAFVAVERNRPDFLGLLKGSRLSISQAGYNTAIDLLRARVPAILVPFAEGNEREQTIRAEAFAFAGLATIADEGRLTPESLDTAIGNAKSPRPHTISCEGVAATASIVSRWL
ncbi:MAG: glycosyltransferase [Proteobacteria bacterium]|nr:glycosyltransferase [Pseudomonadota bacterium]